MKNIILKYAKAFTWNGKVYVREGVTLSEVELNHEHIHAKQQEECGMAYFLLIYLADWVWNLRTIFYAYRNIRFEKEAYYFQDDLTYLDRRKPFAWKYKFENKTINLK